MELFTSENKTAEREEQEISEKAQKSFPINFNEVPQINQKINALLVNTNYIHIINKANYTFNLLTI